MYDVLLTSAGAIMSNREPSIDVESIRQNIRLFVETLAPSDIRAYVDQRIDEGFTELLGQVDGHAAAVWIKPVDRDVLTIAYNVGERGAEIEGKIEQSLDTGLVSKSFNEAQTICHQGFFPHREQSDKADRALDQITAHQIASPFTLFGKKCGAVTVIQSQASQVARHTKWGFEEDDIQRVEAWTAILGRLIEYNFLRKLLKL